MKELKPFIEKRPWGWFREFIKNELSTVKIIFVKKGEAISLQRHLHRDEFWRVLVGYPDITVDKRIVRAKMGDEFEIPRETNHRISAPLDNVEILEVSRGEFNEDDIIREEDKYGRI